MKLKTKSILKKKKPIKQSTNQASQPNSAT
jgi:hypothetical protein